MTKVVHDTDIDDVTLEIANGKLASKKSYELVKQFHARVQQSLFHNVVWELSGNRVKPHQTSTEQRFITIGHSKSASTMDAGYLAPKFPAAGGIVRGINVPDLTVDANGFLDMPGWCVLWYNLLNGYWYVSRYDALNFDTPSSEYIMVLSLNHDDLVGGANARLSDGRIIIQGKNYPDTNWISLTPYLVSGVSNYGGVFVDIRFRRLNNRAYFEGMVNTSSAGYTGGLANLPVQFRPTKQHVFLVSAHTGIARIDVDQNGLVKIITNSGAQPAVSLDGINFGLD